MKKTITVFSKMFFGLELALVLVIPFVIWWSTTPTNVLNSHFLYKLLEIVGIVFLKNRFVLLEYTIDRGILVKQEKRDIRNEKYESNLILCISCFLEGVVI